MPTIVNVTVNTVGSTHSLVVDPDPVRVAAGVRGPIQWHITNPASENWKFRRNGIEITNPGGEFDTPRGGGSRVFTWNNKHTKAATYKYSVRVEKDGVEVFVDPTIMNN
jgi:hypothetical protein